MLTNIAFLDNGLEEDIVPIEDFLTVIAEKTGWNFDEFLETKDVGDVEKTLNVKARIPNNLKDIPLKRGKSRNEIYHFKSIDEHLYEKAVVTNWISD